MLASLLLAVSLSFASELQEITSALGKLRTDRLQNYLQPEIIKPYKYDCPQLEALLEVAAEETNTLKRRRIESFDPNPKNSKRQATSLDKTVHTIFGENQGSYKFSATGMLKRFEPEAPVAPVFLKEALKGPTIREEAEFRLPNYIPKKQASSVIVLESSSSKSVFWNPIAAHRLLNFSALKKAAVASTKRPQENALDCPNFFVPALIAQYILPYYQTKAMKPVDKNILQTEIDAKSLSFYFGYLQQAAFFSTGRVAKTSLDYYDDFRKIVSFFGDNLKYKYPDLNNFGHQPENQIRAKALKGEIEVLNILRVGKMWCMNVADICDGILNFYSEHAGKTDESIANIVAIAKHVKQHPESLPILPTTIQGVVQSISQASPLENFNFILVK